jgi:hypothetical protein
MDRRNKELARKNTELREDIARMGTAHAELIREAIKKEYFGARAQSKMLEVLEGSIKAVEDALLLLRAFKEELAGPERILSNKPGGGVPRRARSSGPRA